MRLWDGGRDRGRGEVAEAVLHEGAAPRLDCEEAQRTRSRERLAPGLAAPVGLKLGPEGGRLRGALPVQDADEARILYWPGSGAMLALQRHMMPRVGPGMPPGVAWASKACPCRTGKKVESARANKLAHATQDGQLSGLHGDSPAKSKR